MKVQLLTITLFCLFNFFKFWLYLCADKSSIWSELLYCLFLLSCILAPWYASSLHGLCRETRTHLKTGQCFGKTTDQPLPERGKSLHFLGAVDSCINWEDTSKRPCLGQFPWFGLAIRRYHEYYKCYYLFGKWKQILSAEFAADNERVIHKGCWLIKVLYYHKIWGLITQNYWFLSFS